MNANHSGKGRSWHLLVLVVGFGFLATSGYSLHHLLSKPAADASNGSLRSAVFLTVIAECASLVISSLFLVLSKNRRDVNLIISNKQIKRKFWLVSLVGLVNSLIYFYALRAHSPVLLAFILNLYPFWYIFVGKLFFKDFNESVTTPVITLFVICVTAIISMNFDPKTFTFGSFIFCSIVPIIFAWIIHFRGTFFDSATIASFVFSSHFFSSPPVIAVGLLYLTISGYPDLGDDLEFTSISYYLLGSISLSLGTYFLHKGNAVDARYNWLPSFLLFLVPGTTALLSVPIKHLTNQKAFDLSSNLVITMIIVVISLGVYGVYREMERRKIASFKDSGDCS